MTTWENEPALKGGRIIAAGDKRVHAQAMKNAEQLVVSLSARPCASGDPILVRHLLDSRFRGNERARSHSKQRRSRNIGIERRPELRTVAILLHQ